jgi:AcrR family transcriptional regulator
MTTPATAAHAVPGATRKSLRARRRDDARVRLLEIVQRLLEAGETFSEISVERLAAEAGMSRTTFYVYFEDKSDLLRAWFTDVTHELNEAAAGWWSLGPGASREDLRDALATIVDSYRPHATLMAATHDAVGYDAGARQLVVHTMDHYVSGLRRHIEAGQAVGFIDRSLPAAETAYWLQWMAERGLHQIPLEADEHEIDRLIDAYTGIVWNALYAPALG